MILFNEVNVYVSFSFFMLLFAYLSQLKIIILIFAKYYFYDILFAASFCSGNFQLYIYLYSLQFA